MLQTHAAPLSQHGGRLPEPKALALAAAGTSKELCAGCRAFAGACDRVREPTQTRFFLFLAWLLRRGGNCRTGPCRSRGRRPLAHAELDCGRLLPHWLLCPFCAPPPPPGVLQGSKTSSALLALASEDELHNLKRPSDALLNAEAGGTACILMAESAVLLTTPVTVDLSCAEFWPTFADECPACVQLCMKPDTTPA